MLKPAVSVPPASLTHMGLKPVIGSTQLADSKFRRPPGIKKSVEEKIYIYRLPPGIDKTAQHPLLQRIFKPGTFVVYRCIYAASCPRQPQLRHQITTESVDLLFRITGIQHRTLIDIYCRRYGLSPGLIKSALPGKLKHPGIMTFQHRHQTLDPVIADDTAIDQT